MMILTDYLKRKGKNELYNNNQLTRFNTDYAFTRKVMLFDDDIYKAVSYLLFGDFYFKYEDVDKHFKKVFINKFKNRQIKKQTTDSFISEMLGIIFIYEDYLYYLYNNKDNLLVGKSVSTGTSQSIGENKHRDANVELSDSTPNFDLQNDIIQNAKSSSAYVSNDKNNAENYSDNINYSFNNLEKFRNNLDYVFNKIDKKCFCQVFL